VNPVNPPSQVDSVIKPISRITSQVSPELRTTSPSSGTSSSVVSDVLDRAPLSDSASFGSAPSSGDDQVVSSRKEPAPASPASQQTQTSSVDSQAKCRVHNSHSCPLLKVLDATHIFFSSEKSYLDLVQQEGKNSAFEFDGPNGTRHRLSIHDHVFVREGWVFYTQPKNKELSYWVIQLPGTTSPEPDPPEHWYSGSCRNHGKCLWNAAFLFHGDWSYLE
jgi:hypothetical protein